MPVDPAALAASLRELTASQLDDDEIHAGLQAVVEACVAIFGVAGSGLMLADDESIIRYVASSDAAGRVLEKAEADSGEGPCTEAFVHAVPVSSRDLTADERWPRVAAAIRGGPVRAVLGVPVRIGGVPVGTLDVYRDAPSEWDDSETEALVQYSTVIGRLLASALSAHRAQELADQLQYALDYRVVIERGVGYLMAREHVDAVTAFNQLRSAARNSRTKIGDVAGHLLETGSLR